MDDVELKNFEARDNKEGSVETDSGGKSSHMEINDNNKSPDIVSQSYEYQKNKNEDKNIGLKIKEYFINYFKKWKGYEKAPRRADYEEIAWSWFTSFVGILVLALIHYRVMVDKEMLMLIGSFAASAVLIFAAPKAPLSQPRCLIGGHIISAIIGCAIRVALVYTEANFETACALAVSVSILVMHLTTTLHPPGGATALICVMSTEQRWRGFYFVLVPVASGAFIMLITALIINNFARKRSYPVYW